VCNAANGATCSATLRPSTEWDATISPGVPAMPSTRTAPHECRPKGLVGLHQAPHETLSLGEFIELSFLYYEGMPREELAAHQIYRARFEAVSALIRRGGGRA
jgi:hypothetical protein